MQLKFSYVLASLAVRTRKPKYERLVDNLTCAATDARERSRSWHRYFTGESLERIASVRAGDAHHRYRRWRPAGGKGKDGLTR